MYGYVIVNKPEMKFKEYDRYRSYYCGLCEVLKDKYGFNGQISISYDMTFLVLLLTGLYEPDTGYYTARCVAHPVSKHEVRRNEMTDYVADMNVLMTYYKCMDDWKDEKKVTRRAFAGLLKKHAEKIGNKYPQKAAVIKQSLDELSEAEAAGEDNIDRAASYFAKLMSVIAAVRQDEWTQELEGLGYYLGKFIYICDAYEDLEEDLKAGRYNVFKTHYMQEDFDEICESILNSTMAECARHFERLPIIQEAEILRNIIYSGVWTRFQAARAKRNKQSEQNRREESD